MVIVPLFKAVETISNLNTLLKSLNTSHFPDCESSPSPSSPPPWLLARDVYGGVPVGPGAARPHRVGVLPLEEADWQQPAGGLADQQEEAVQDEERHGPGGRVHVPHLDRCSVLQSSMV